MECRSRVCQQLASHNSTINVAWIHGNTLRHTLLNILWKTYGWSTISTETVRSYPYRNLYQSIINITHVPQSWHACCTSLYINMFIYMIIYNHTNAILYTMTPRYI